MNPSDEPISPKTNHRIIDSEAVIRDDIDIDTEAEAKDQKNRDPKNNSKTNPKKPDVKKKTSFLTHVKRFMIATIVVAIGGVGYWFYGSTQNDWQVEKINELQTKMVQLSTEVERLKSGQNDLVSQMGSVAQQSSIAELSIEDQNRLAEIDQIKANLQSLAMQLESTDDGAEKSLNSVPSVETEAEDAPKIEVADSNQLPQIEAQLAEMKANYQKLRQQFSDNLDKASENEETSNFQAISSMQIQQWILHINTQWLLTANSEQTRKNLYALEQAVGASDLENKNLILRMIGEDLNAVQDYARSEKPLETVENLKNWIVTMPLIEMKPLEVSRETPEEEVNDADQVTTVWQKIQAKLGSLFSVRKRDEASQLTHAERLVHQDVLKERGLLLLDRVEWALMMNSQGLLNQSSEAFEGYILQTFPEKNAEFELLYAPVKQFEYTPPQALKIVEGM